MPRPEIPITWDGPAADLARALRRLRSQAGTSDYRTLAEAARYSSTTLADAAAGRTRPSLDVARAFAQACGASTADQAEINDLWKAADKAHKAARTRELRSRRRLRTISGNPEFRSPRRSSQPARGQPRPEPTGTAAQFVQQLRVLRAWAGQPGYKVISRRAGIELPRSTMYDALDPRRATLPSLGATQLIVAGCAPESIEEWTEAWRAIKIREIVPEDASPESRLAQVPTAS